VELEEPPASEHATNDTRTSGTTAAKAILFIGIATRLLLQVVTARIRQVTRTMKLVCLQRCCYFKCL